MEYTTEDIYKNFSKKIRVFVSRRIPDKESVDDIMQNVFLKIHANMDKIKDNTKIISWIFQISRNTIIDHHRTNNRSFESGLEIPVYDNHVFEEADEVLEKGIRAIISTLPEKYRDALLAIEINSMPQKEYAAEIGLSLSAAKSRIQRGRERLKGALLEYCHFEFDKYGSIIEYKIKKCPVCYTNKKNH